MPSHKTEIQASFLSICTDEMAYHWLREHWKEPIKGSYGSKWDSGVDQDEREVLDAILFRRDSRLIDLGLAQFGYSEDILRSVYIRGDLAVRCAVASNPLGFIFCPMEEVTLPELEAIASNRYLHSKLYEDLLGRQRTFGSLTDEQWKTVLLALGNNPRMSTPYKDGVLLDGYDCHQYNKVFDDAWALLETVPATEEWADILYMLLRNTVRPYKSEKVNSWLQRWNLDTTYESYPVSSFFLRSFVADYMEANDELLNSTDAALRLSFYRRFAPYTFKDWPERLKAEKELSLFFDAASDNPKIWRTESERQRLRQISSEAPVDGLYNTYRWKDQKFRDSHPAWFDHELPRQEDAVQVRLEAIEERLQNMSERLDSLRESVSYSREAPTGFFGRLKSL